MTEQERQTIQGLVNQERNTAPIVGRTVRIIHGKHRGVVGRVAWHGPDKFRCGEMMRYTNGWMHAALVEARGRAGYRIGIDVEGKRIFASAEHAVVCVDY